MQTQSTADFADPTKALERFVIENDDLMELEERIGRFNIFDALRVSHAEIRHSNFFAWLIDPGESHGQGALFLNALLMDLLRSAPAEKRPISPVELDVLELRGVEIRREWQHVDLLIVCEEPGFVVAIENKVYSGEHGGQLRKYEERVRRAFADKKHFFVLLTLYGGAASDDDWVSYSYADIHRVIARCRRANSGAIGDDVAAFIDHYLALIGSRFMDDPKLDELCKRIYRNHRQAMDLIYERVGSLQAQIAAALEARLKADDRWRVFFRNPRYVFFTPRSWPEPLEELPTGKRWALPLKWMFELRRNQLRLFVEAQPYHHSERRKELIAHLSNHPTFGLKSKLKAPTSIYTRLYSEVVATWSDDDEVEPEELWRKAQPLLERLDEQLKGVPEAAMKILSQPG